MIDKIRVFTTNSTSPYKNLALEKYLFDRVKSDELILYLWQNEKTVVIGRNQNPFKECRINFLLGNDGRIARRLTGGGAVFHDMGNLNFSFISMRENEDIEFNLSIIKKAIEKFGLKIEITGRNDLTIDGYKFSGNAFLRSKGRALHHGTIMLDVDTDYLEKALNVDSEKLKAKGVDSVKSRVKSLSYFDALLTIDTLKTSIIEAFAESASDTLGVKVPSFPYNDLVIDADKYFEEDETLPVLTNAFGNTEWIMGRNTSFSIRINDRFSWGDFDLNMNVEDGVITEVKVFSDDLDVDFARKFEDALLDCQFTLEAIKNRLSKADFSAESQKLSDALNLISKADCFSS